MVSVSVKCPFCGSENIRKAGNSKNIKGEIKKRYFCCNSECSHKTFQEEKDYAYNARKPEIKRKIVEFALDGNGVRATSRLLKVSQGTVITIEMWSLMKCGVMSEAKNVNNGFGEP